MYFRCEKLNIVLYLRLKKLVCDYNGVIKVLGNADAFLGHLRAPYLYISLGHWI